MTDYNFLRGVDALTIIYSMKVGAGKLSPRQPMIPIKLDGLVPVTPINASMLTLRRLNAANSSRAAC